MPPKRPKEALTPGDRAVTAFLTGCFAFATMLLVWFVVMYAGGRAGHDVMLPFYWTWIVGLIVGAFGAVLGPETMMDGFEWVWWIIGLGFWKGVPNPSDRRHGRF